MNTYDLDKLLSDKNERITLNDSTHEYLPETFEEWCQIHGEPEYLYEKKERSSNDLKIVVSDCTSLQTEIDTTGIVYEDNKGKKNIDYARFLDVFTHINPIVYNNGVFYSPDGAVSKDTLKQDIHFSLIDNGYTGRLDTPVNSIFDSMKNHVQVEHLLVDDKVIPLANGDLHIGTKEWEFRLGEFKHCPYRLSVNYTPVSKPTPLFDKWLTDVFAPEDIPIIQEIMGYCLIPTTSAQEAFILVGDAGVGKSGFGTILASMMGNAFVSMETQQLVTERFQIATIENKLVAYDDDLGSAALTETGLLKKLITADVPIKAERKYADPHEFTSYCRIVASANFMLSSLYDDSDGFYRRLHPILVKNKDPHRKTIRKFYEMIIDQEKEQIFKWALIGLKRVIMNGWKISWSQRSIDYMGMTKSQNTHFEDFFQETCEINQDGDISSAELRKLYSRWCRENGIKDTSDRRMFRWFSDNAERMNATFTTHLHRSGKRVRGYQGVKVRNEWKDGVIF